MTTDFSVSDLDSKISSVPVIGRLYRIGLIADEVLPVVRSGFELVRAEAALAGESIVPTFVAVAVAAVGSLIVISALAAGAVAGLYAAGWPLLWAIATPAGIGLVILLIGYFLMRRGLAHLTFVESRARFRALLEVIDEE